MSHARGRDPRASGRFAPATKIALLASAALVAVGTALLLAFALAGPGPGQTASAGPAASSGTPAGRAPRPSPPKSPQPAPAPRRHRDPLPPESYVSSRSGSVLAAVYDVATGQTWELGRGAAQAEASIVKVDILETLLSRNRATGARLSAADSSLAQRMIEESDNDATTSLWYAAGAPGQVGSFNAAAGLRHTALSRCVQCPGFPWPGWGLTTTTAADQIVLLRKLLAPSSLLTSGQRRYVLRLMEDVTPAQRWGVSGGVPLWATVALKNGWLPLNSSDTDWQINSIGWISGQGRDYLMAVLTTGNPSEQYGIDTIERLSAIVWRDMR
jgi:beta-lactamase class A